MEIHRDIIYSIATMQKNIDDINIKSLQQLISPIDLMEQIPVTETAVTTVERARAQARKIIHGNDDRLLVIVGPCSIHNTDAALDLLSASVLL